MINILYYIKTRIRTHLTTSHFQDKQQRWAVPENQAQLVWAESDLNRPCSIVQLVMAGCWHGPVHYCSSPWLWKGLGSESHLTLTYLTWPITCYHLSSGSSGLRILWQVAQMHQSQLMVALRVLSQQIQTIKVMTECPRDCQGLGHTYAATHMYMMHVYHTHTHIIHTHTCILCA